MSLLGKFSIIDAIIFRRLDGSSKCSGAVTYENQTEALKAIESLHGTKLNDRTIIVKRDESITDKRDFNAISTQSEFDNKKTVFVTNIGFDVQLSQLRKYLEQAGEISSITLFEGQNGTHRGRAVIQFFDRESAANAILKFNGVQFENRILYIRFSHPM